MRVPQLAAKLPTRSVVALIIMVWIATPSVVLAAPAEELLQGPTWKQLFGWGFLGLVACAAVYALARWVYGVCLEANWPVDFALGLVVTGTLMAWLAIASGVFLFLYNWPQPWTRIAGYGVIVAFVVMLLVAMFGRNRQSA